MATDGVWTVYTVNSRLRTRQRARGLGTKRTRQEEQEDKAEKGQKEHED